MRKEHACFDLLQGRHLIASLAILFFALTSQAAVPNAQSAIAEASRSGQFLFLTFYNAKDAVFTSLVTSIANFRKSNSKKAAIYNAKISDPGEKETIERYGVSGAKFPLLLIIAPNGVVTAGFQLTATNDQLQQSMDVSELLLKILKPLQERKVVLVSLQSKATKFNMESAQAVKEFSADQQFKQFVSAIQADPNAKESQEFLKQIGLAETLAEATVVILLPPRSIGKILKGKISKADILSALQSCTAGSGCCGPKK